MKDERLKFEITEHIGVIKEKKGGWNKELNLVSWNNGAPKYDIREWSPDHDKMSKGITLTEEELINIYQLIKERFDSLGNEKRSKVIMTSSAETDKVNDDIETESMDRVDTGDGHVSEDFLSALERLEASIK